MKKYLVLVLALFFTLSLIKPLFAASTEKIGYVDMGKIFDEYDKTKEFDKNLELKAQSFEKERDTKDAEFKQMADKLALLSDKEKEKKQKEYEDKRKAAEEELMAKANELRKERNDKAKDILTDIETAVGNYARKEGYTMILDVRSLVYNNKTNDITDKILTALQSGYKKSPDKK